MPIQKLDLTNQALRVGHVTRSLDGNELSGRVGDRVNESASHAQILLVGYVAQPCVTKSRSQGSQSLSCPVARGIIENVQFKIFE